MEYRLDDFFDNGDLEEPTERLHDVVTAIYDAYLDLTDGIEPLKIYIVGGIAREDTSEEGRKDVDFLITPRQKMDDLEKETLYFQLTNFAKEYFGENYEVFIGTTDQEKIDLTELFS